MTCVALNEAEEAADAADAAKKAAQWVADHPWAVIGTLIVIAGVVYIVVNIGGPLVLVAI